MTDFTSNPSAENTETSAENIRTFANTCVISTADNSKSYSSFNICLVLIYMNDQLCYYHTSEALLDVDKTKFRNQMKKCKNMLELID